MSGTPTTRETGASATLSRPRHGDLLYRDPHRYEVLGEHGRGGIGTVLRARDLDLDRVVAVKELLQPGSTAEARFIREALITARLQHPGIVPVHEAGRWPNGRPFYSMKLVEGRPLRGLIRAAGSRSERLGLVPHLIAVADAIAYAHAQGIIHRDLKPSNVMVGEFGEVVVIDWGLAKAIDGQVSEPVLDSPYRSPARAGHATRTGAIVGTPRYMSPQQARGEPAGPASDIYALGAMLFEIISGQALFSTLSPDDALDVLRERDDAALRHVNELADIPPELHSILEHTLGPIGDRYETASAFADELRRFQQGRLVAAHRYTALDRVGRWARNNRTTVRFASVTLLLAVLGAAYGVFRIERERTVAVEHRNDLIVSRAAAAIDTDPTEVIAWLKTHPDLPSNDMDVRVLVAEAVSRGVAEHVVSLPGPVAYVDVSQDDELAVSVMQGYGLVAFTADGQIQARLDIAGSIRPVFVGSSHRVVWATEDGVVLLWTPDSGEVVRLDPTQSTILRVASSPSGDRVAAAGDGGVYVYDLHGSKRHAPIDDATVSAVELDDAGEVVYGDTRGRLWTWQTDRRPVVAATTDAPIAAGFRTATRELAALDLDGVLHKWSSEGELVAERPVVDGDLFRVARRGDLLVAGSFTEVTATSVALMVPLARYPVKGPASVAISPDGEQLAWTNDADDVTVATLRLGAYAVLAGHRSNVGQVAFTHDGSRLVSTSEDGTARIWPNRGGIRPTAHYRMPGPMYTFSFAPHAHRVVSDSNASAIRVTDLDTGHTRSVPGHRGVAYGVEHAGDGSMFATAGWDRTLRVWDAASLEQLAVHEFTAIVRHLAFSHDSRFLAGVDAEGNVAVFEHGTHRVASAGPLAAGDTGIYRVAFAPNASSELYVGGHSGDLMYWAWNRAEPERIDHLDSGIVRLIPIEGGVLVGTDTGQLGLRRRGDPNGGWTLELGARIKGLEVDAHHGRWAAGTVDGDLVIGELEAPANRRLRVNVGSAVTRLAFSPTGEQVAIGTDIGGVFLVDASDGGILQLRSRGSRVTDIQFTPAGDSVYAATLEGRLTAWRLTDVPASRWIDDPRAAVARATAATIAPSSIGRTAAVSPTDPSEQ